MPTYEYACTECGQHVEVVQSMSAAPLTTCSACGCRLRKVFSPIGIVFKGSGFYRTDSRAKSGAGASKGGRSGSDGSAGKSDSKAGTSGSGEKGSKGGGSSSKPSEKSA